MKRLQSSRPQLTRLNELRASGLAIKDSFLFYFFLQNIIQSHTQEGEKKISESMKYTTFKGMTCFPLTVKKLVT